VTGALAQGGGQQRGGGQQQRGGGQGGQGGGMMGGMRNMQVLQASPVSALMMPGVRQELKITDEQNTKLREVGEKHSLPMLGMAAGAGGGNRGGGAGGAGGGNRGGGGAGMGGMMMGGMRAMGGMMGGAELTAEQKAQAAEITKDVMAVLTPEQQKRLKQINLQVRGGAGVLDEDVSKELGITSEQRTRINDLLGKQREANMALLQNRDMDMQDRMQRFQNNTRILEEEIAKVLTEAQRTKLKEMQGPAFTPNVG
jgi:hypothetical protein